MSGIQRYLIVLVHGRYPFSRLIETDSPLDDPIFLFDLGTRYFGSAVSENDPIDHSLNVYTLSDFRGSDDQFLDLARQNRFTRARRTSRREEHACQRNS